MILCFSFQHLLSDKGASNISLPVLAGYSHDKQGASSADEVQASNEDFQLSLPKYETPEHELYRKAVPGSSSSLDELCGRKKNKPDREERFSKLSKKFFGKKNKDDSEHVDEILISTENTPNGKETTVKENHVEIEICPIDHVPDNDKPDIDIYPLEEAPATADAMDNCLPNGADGKDTSSDLEINQRKNEKDGNQGINVETATDTCVAQSSTERRHSLDDELYQQLLSGNMDIAIPNTAKMVRIFTSSTFTGNQQFRFKSKLKLKLKKMMKSYKPVDFCTVDF